MWNNLSRVSASPRACPLSQDPVMCLCFYTWHLHCTVKAADIHLLQKKHGVGSIEDNGIYYQFPRQVSRVAFCGITA